MKHIGEKFGMYGLVWWIFGIVFLGAYFSFQKEKSLGLLLVLYILGGFVPAIIYGRRFGKGRAIRNIVNHSPDYAEFAKAYIKVDREEKEFKKSLLN